MVILPLLVILGITALKGSYEDFKGHQSDWHVNQPHTPIRVLAGGDWQNDNATKDKSRTFVRRITLEHFKHRKSVAEADQEKGEKLGGEKLAQNPVGTHPPDIEFDPEDADAEPTHDHHHFWHREGIAKPHWKKKIGEDVKVGDFMKILDNENITADILICATSEDKNIAFVETRA